MTHEKELESSILAWNDPLMNECFREPTEELNEWWIRGVGIGTKEAKAVVARLGACLLRWHGGTPRFPTSQFAHRQSRNIFLQKSASNHAVLHGDT
jgi:hypothetical protein